MIHLKSILEAIWNKRRQLCVCTTKSTYLSWNVSTTPITAMESGNGHLLVVSSLKVNIAKKRIAVIQTTIEMKNATLLINITPMKIMQYLNSL